MTAALVRRATEISRDVLRVHAAGVDRDNRFPRESIDALRDGGLVALMVPAALGGAGGSVRDLAEVAAVLGEECLSTALIWSMHSQQVAIVGAHGNAEHGRLLGRVVDHGALIASVTSEPGRGSDVWTSDFPVVPVGVRLRVDRPAPVVSYGAEAGLYLIKMRAGPERTPNEIAMVLVAAEDGTVRVMGDWNASGMRGTRSVPMHFDVVVDSDRIVGPDYRTLAFETMVPIGYVAWSAAWLGAARGSFQTFVRSFRDPKRPRRNLTSDLLKHRLARLRLSLDLVDALLHRVVAVIEAGSAGSPGALRSRLDASQFILLSNLKVASSEMAYDVVNALVEIAGMRAGYLKGDALGLERVLRDLRSASLMYHNDQLLAANGNMILIEGTALGQAWHRDCGHCPDLPAG